MSRCPCSISACSILASAGWFGLLSCLPLLLHSNATGLLTHHSFFRIYAFASLFWHKDVCWVLHWSLDLSFEPFLFVTYSGGGSSRCQLGSPSSTSLPGTWLQAHWCSSQVYWVELLSLLGPDSALSDLIQTVLALPVYTSLPPL